MKSNDRALPRALRELLQARVGRSPWLGSGVGQSHSSFIAVLLLIATAMSILLFLITESKIAKKRNVHVKYVASRDLRLAATGDENVHRVVRPLHFVSSV